MEHRSQLLIIMTLLLSSSVLLNACEEKPQEKAPIETVYTVTKEPTAFELYYQSTMKPLKTESVTSPVDGNVTDVLFYYGETADKGEVLLKINSPTLQTTYRQALTTYLQDKDQYLLSVANFQGTQALKKAGLIDEQTYTSTKSTVETNSLKLMSSRYDLVQALKYIPDVSLQDVEQLSLSDLDEISTILSKQYDVVTITAPAEGIILFPDKSSADAKQLTAGVEVKKGQSLVILGNLSSLQLDIKVGQKDVNRLRTGQKVTVTTPAIPNLKLDGEIASIGAQAEVSSTETQFPVAIVVENIPTEDQQLIRVGMTAKVDINIETPAELQVPINAIIQQNGKTMVQLVDQKTGKAAPVPVTTGQTTETQISITSGLKEGDKILVRD